MGGAMPAGDKQLPFSLKKMALRELPSEAASVVNKSPGTTPLPTDKRLGADSSRAVVTKRQRADGPSSPGYHNVYVRRKVESEHSKMNYSHESKKIGRDEIKDQSPQQNMQQKQSEKPKVPSPVVDPVSPKSSEKPTTGHVPEKNVPPPPIASSTPVEDNVKRSSNRYWEERYIRLQAYLENCDRSSQEDYIRMLRSLPAVGRSKLAFELEKRAIQLLLEEGKELQRMKVLNVLGKAAPTDPSAQTPLQQR